MIPRGTTGLIRHIFIQDSASTTGAGKTGLAYDTAGLSCYYLYPGGTASAVTLETITTLGTYQAPTSNAHMRFKEVSATNMPGWYEIHIHNDWASTANGRTKVNLCLKGASGMAPLNLSMDLIGFGIQSFAPDVSVYDKTGFELTSSERSSIASAVWSAGTRTLTSFGTLVSDIWSAGTRSLTTFGSLASDTATAVWSAGTRTLTSFGTLVSDIWNNASRSLTSYLDSSGVTTLLGRVIGTIAPGTHQPQSGDAYARIGANGAGLTNLGDSRLANLDATVSSRLATSGYTAPDNASISAIKATTDKVDTTVEQDGSVWRYTANALEQAPTGSAPTAGQIADAVWDEALSEHLSAGSAGEALAASGSGGIPPSVLAMIEATYNGVAALQGAEIVLQSPMGLGGDVSILWGYDYYAADGRAPTWTSSAWPNLTGASVRVVDYATRQQIGSAATVVVAGTGSQTVRWDISKTDIAASRAAMYILEATLSGGRVVPLAAGRLTAD